MDEAQALSLTNGSIHWRIWRYIHINTMSDEDFGDYMAGLIEGDGCFKAAGLGLEFDILDYPLALMIAVRLGANLEKHLKYRDPTQRHPNGQKAVIAFFFREDTVSFNTLYDLVNGRFVGPFKVQQLEEHRLNGAID